MVHAAVARGNIASVLADLGRYPDALALLREVLPTLRATRIRHVITWALRNLGQVASLVGNHEAADASFAEAIDVAARPADAATARIWWAESRAVRGQVDAAIELCEAVDEVPASVRPVRERVLAWVAATRGDRPRAAEHLTASLEVSRELSRSLDAALALRALSEVDPDAGYEAEADALLADLGVVAVPAVPTMPGPERDIAFQPRG